MNPKYSMRKLFYDKHNIIGGKEDLLCLGGRVLSPFTYREAKSLEKY